MQELVSGLLYFTGTFVDRRFRYFGYRSHLIFCWCSLVFLLDSDLTLITFGSVDVSLLMSLMSLFVACEGSEVNTVTVLSRSGRTCAI